ncbi:MAG: DUF465 domain-containing protein [Candidatus Aminicenantes bacterium]|nr:DUF465 domain-containing protein [Candidatus Aminicenantes bacterium]
MKENELKELLLKKDEAFRKAYKQHKQLEKKLEKLKQKNFLTEIEKMEEREFKKKKLFLKDKMYYLMTEYRKTHK